MARIEREVWHALVESVRALDVAVHWRRPKFTDADIVQTLLWGRLHHQTVQWACDPASWPLHERRYAKPSPTTMCRRLRTPSVRALLDALQTDTAAEPTLAYVVDGKPLVVSKHSTDPLARHGRGAGGMDKGYKLHLIGDVRTRVHMARVTPLNTPEQEVARRMVKSGGLGEGYLLADSLYDWDALHRQCARSGLRLLVNRRPGRVRRGVRERGVSVERLACIASTESPRATFAPSLLKCRGAIERIFARLETRWRIGHPPFHIRGLRRVRLWVQTALILDRFTNDVRRLRAA